MSQRYLPEVLFENGFTDLISVVPPDATISPGSKLLPIQLGKVPGRRNRNGTWGGYPWLEAEHTVDDVREWMTWGANVGMRADHFPGLDIDSEDQVIAQALEEMAIKHFGEAPVRYGRRPKRLLMYSTYAPFGRLRVWGTRGIPGTDDFEKHLVEVLGTGQQYLVHGIHPTRVAYEWTTDMSQVIPDMLTPITMFQAEEFRKQVAEFFDACGFEVSFEGDGTPSTKATAAQDGLRAPSLDSVFEAMSVLPNDGDFDGRQEWLNVAYALRAACGPEGENEARELFLEWSLKWPGDGAHPKGNDPAVVLEEFRRCVGPYKIGWPWLSELARGYGYNNAADDFEPLEAAPADDGLPEPPDTPPEDRAKRYSDFWLAEEVAKEHADVLRYSPQSGMWYVWTGKLWKPDEGSTKTLRLIYDVLWRAGKERAQVGDKEAAKDAKMISSNAAIMRVEAILRHEPGVAIAVQSFDADPWLLNTPDGIVNLRSGERMTPDPAALCSKATRVAVDFGGPCPEWRRFLAEATGGDRDLEAYLQRYAGYCLTGITQEQQFSVFHGDGGNGKGTFKTVLEKVLGDYAWASEMAEFLESNVSRHSTGMASMNGKRLVTASEASKNQKLDVTKIKGLSGEDTVTARFMRENNFTFQPQLKLMLLMNHPPVLRDTSWAMQRRLHLVPFTEKPKNVDKALGKKLEAEYPAILAWMIEGCLAWQREGLNPPAKVTDYTADYFEREDFLGNWMKERLADAPDGVVELADLYNDYNAWASEQGLFTFRGAHKFSAELESHVPLGKHPRTRRRVLRGKRLLVNNNSLMEPLP